MTSREHIQRDQDGVISRRQLSGLGMTDGAIKGLIRRRELTKLLPGVFVEHSGRPTWRQRAWAGALAVPASALDDLSALQAWGCPAAADDIIHLAIPHTARARSLPGYRIRRDRRFDERVSAGSGLPRMRLEESAIRAASRQERLTDATALLSDLCQARRTTAVRLAHTLSGTPRVRHREWLRSLPEDIDAGACSVLERGYLELVERPHGLPSASRQATQRTTLGTMLGDVDYDPYPVLVELDGRAFHSTSRQRDRDLERDLNALGRGRVTARIGWQQVFDRPCSTAAQIARLLRRAGWAGQMRTCNRSECLVAA